MTAPASSLRIPGVADLLTVSDPSVIRSMAENPDLDRVAGGGPLLTRVLRRRLARALRTAEGPLPSALPRGSAERDAMRADLAARLEAAERDDRLAGAVAEAARFVAGGNGTPGPLAQTLLGRLFVTGFTATAETWDAARVIDRALAPPSLGSVRDALAGRLPAAQRVLSKAMAGDRNGVHAIGVAAHNLAATLDALRALDKSLPERAALARALAAPARVARQGTSVAETVAGRVRPGTFVVLEVGAAAERTLDPRVTFLSEAWSGCPAHAFVPRLSRRIWREAGGAP
jgi:hypothetical protein